MSVIEGLPEGCILGVNFSGLHDSAIAIVDPSGRPVFACALERFTRVKRDGRWPKAMMDMVPWDRIRAVAVPALPHAAAVRLGEQHAVSGWPLPIEGGSLAVSLPDAALDDHLATLPVPVLRFDHHHSHAASAWHFTGRDSGLVLTCDDGAASCPWTAAVYRATGDRLELAGGMARGTCWSPTVVYTMVTALLGLQPGLQEGMVAGLAARGDATEERLAEFRRLADPLLPRMDQLLYWAFVGREDRAARLVVDPTVRQQWRALFATLADADLAACVQGFTDEMALAMLDNALVKAGRPLQNLCLAGRLFANVRRNQMLVRRAFPPGIVASSVTDDGVALGAALLGWRETYPDRERAVGRTTLFLGPDISEQAIDASITRDGLEASRPQDLALTVAEHLLAGRTVAVARGRLEFGSRARGNRSILRRTRHAGIDDVQHGRRRRTEHMSFEPVLQAADAADQLRGMRANTSAAPPDLVGPDDAPFLNAVIAAFRAVGGEPAILQASFDIQGEPIVCAVDDALSGFAAAALDVLVLGDRVIARADNTAALERIAAAHAPPPPEVDLERLARVEKDLALARLEVASFARELLRVRSCRLLRMAAAFDRTRTAVGRVMLAAARGVVGFVWRHLPSRTRAGLTRRIAERRLPWLLQSLVRRLEPRAMLGLRATPLDRVDRIFTTAPRVSVVIPCFNQGELLLETLASLQRQTFPFFETIVVDDGSTDMATLAVLEQLPWPGLDVRVLRQANGGPARARNVGIAEARADLILPLDADDTLAPSCLMQMVALLDQRKDLGIAYCDIRFFGEKNGVSTCPEYDLEALLAENFMVVTSMFRKALWQSVGGYREELVHGYEDWCLWLDLAAVGWYGKRIPEPLFHYRIKKASRNVTAVRNNTTLIAQIRARHAQLYADTALHELWRRRAVWSDPQPVAAPEANDQPLVTVMIPCFNYGRYVEDAIRSALAQTYENLEILVLDDGSTDPATVELLQTCSWPKTRVLRHANMGLAATRNRGFEIAAGDYVVPLDADDMLLPEMVEKCLRVLRAQPSAGWAYTDIRCFDHGNAVHRQEDYNLALELTNNHSSVCAMIRKAAWRAAGGYNPNMRKGYEDWDFWISCSEKGWHGKLVDGTLFAYRLHGVSMVTESLAHHQQLVNTIRRNHQQLYLPWNVEAIRDQWLPRIVDRRQLPPVTCHGLDAPWVRAPGSVLFSIVVPVYRHDVYLRQCIDSALQQTCQDFEILLVDDGSGSAAIDAVLAAFVADPRVRILVNDENRGIAFSLNRAITNSRGDYLAFLDCDDFLVPEALARVAAFLTEGRTKYYVSTQILDVDENGALVRKRTRHETPADLYRGMFGGHLKVVKRSVFERVGLLDEDMSGCQDYEFLLRMQETYPVDFLQQYLYCYRWHGATVSVTKQGEQASLGARVANETRYRRWLMDDGARKGLYERTCVFVAAGTDAAGLLTRLRASTGLPLVVAVEEAPGACTLYGSERRSEALRRLAEGVVAGLDALVAASNSRWITCLRPGMQVADRWLEQLYFLLTVKVGKGVAPRIVDAGRQRIVSAGLERQPDGWVRRAAGCRLDDLDAMRIMRCDGVPFWGSLFPVGHLRACLGGDRQLHAGLDDTVVAVASTAEDRFYVQPAASLSLEAAVALVETTAAAS